MGQFKTILVMAGSREARGLITGLTGRRHPIIASLPEPARMFGTLPVPTRVGSFASPEALRNWMAGNGVATVIDASHAFDSNVTKMVSTVCASLGLPYLRVLRAAWQATARDSWNAFATIAEAAKSVPPTAHVFSNTGRLTLPAFAGFSGAKLYLRQTHALSGPEPFPFVEFVEGHPPFTQFQEQDLFRELHVTHLICRNVGGAASMSKLLAARELGIPVMMVQRVPTPAHLEVVETVADALIWQGNT